MPSLGQCLQLLGLSAGASKEQIKQAYHDLAKVWHPDRFTHDPRLQKQAEEKLKAINEAYDLLMGNHPQSDRFRARPSPQPTEPAVRTHQGPPFREWIVSAITILIGLVLVGTALFFYEKTFRPLSPPTRSLAGLA